MKKIKLIILLSTFLLLTSFKPTQTFHYHNITDLQLYNSNTIKKEYLGKWIPVNDIDDSKKSIAKNIVEINFKRNFTLKIKISENNVIRKITGKWSLTETDSYKKILGNNAKLNGRLLIEYSRNGKGMNIFTLTKKLKNEKILLKSGDVLFEKK